MISLRRLGTSDIFVSPVALGCWPISGMTTLGATDPHSLETLRECQPAGINHLDSAFSYGANGESDRLIRRLLSDSRRDDWVIATKAGVHWNADGSRGQDARPETLQRQLKTSLTRLDLDYVDLFYLHAPDGITPIRESAEGCLRLKQQGLARCIGASNVDLDQLKEFHAACPVDACQLPYNMLQRDIEKEIVPWCQQNNVSLFVYWALMKGLLTGKFPRDHAFPQNDKRRSYEIFQGQSFQRAQDVLDELRQIGQATGRSVMQIVVNWTLHRPGITSVLCGAKRAGQIRESATAMGWQLTDQDRQRIDRACHAAGFLGDQWPG